MLHLKRDAVQGWVDGETIAVGDLAVVGGAGVEIVLISKCVGLFSPTLFTWHGVTLADKRVICVKGLYKHTDLFRDICGEQHYLATPGICSPDWKARPYTRLSRPMWPLDEDPLGLD
ncbi:MAG: microcystin degradation protein MlrC-like protein [Devosia sp.]|nr:microcystin degradation protein MlrC-like protein [Devosia sp.]